jgi:hypothetical protein
MWKKCDISPFVRDVQEIHLSFLEIYGINTNLAFRGRSGRKAISLLSERCARNTSPLLERRGRNTISRLS